MDRTRIKYVKTIYEPGTTVICNKMHDPYHPVPSGTKGVVTNVDDIGTIHVKWSNGQSLGLIPGVDDFEIDRIKL